MRMRDDCEAKPPSAVHEIDIARFLLKEEFAWVTVTSPRPSRKAPAMA